MSMKANAVHKPIPDAHGGMIRKAKAGDDRFGRMLMFDAATYIERGDPLPEPLAAYIVKALKQNKFNTKRPSGAQKDKNHAKSDRIFFAVELARRTVGNYESYAVVSQKYHWGTAKTIERAYKKHEKKYADLWDLTLATDKELEERIERYANYSR